MSHKESGSHPESGSSSGPAQAGGENQYHRDLPGGIGPSQHFLQILWLPVGCGQRYAESTDPAHGRSCDGQPAGGGSSIRDALVSALEYMAENQAQIGLLLKECDYSFFRDVKLPLPDFQMKLVSFFPSSMSQREKRAYASFIQYGTLHLVVEWLLGGCVISPQEEVNVISSVLSKVMGSPLQNPEKMDDK